MATTYTYRIQNRSDAASDWTSNDPILLEGEFGYESDTGKLKLGDGSTAWSSLIYFSIDTDGSIYVLDGKKINIGTGNDGQIYASSDDLYIDNVTQDKDIIFRINDGGVQTEVMRIEGSTSRVGVGKASPSEVLEVAGNIQAISATSPDIYYVREDATIAAGNNLGQVFFGGYLSAQYDWGASILGEADGTWTATSDSPGRLTFWTTPSSSVTLTERMRITSAGNVGIGTASPGDYNSGFNDLVVYNSGGAGITIAGGTTDSQYIAFADGTSGTAEYSGYLGYIHNGNYLLLGTAGVERIRIDSSGNVGIGETIPDSLCCLNQGAVDTAIFTMKSSDVAHGLTQIAETDTYFTSMKADGAGGGVKLQAILDGDETPHIAVTVHGYSRDALDTTKSVAGLGAIELYASQHDGANALADIVADGNVFSIRCRRGGSDETVLIVDEDGDIHYDGTTNATAWDEEDDIQLMTALSPRWQEKVATRHRERLVELGIMSAGGFISTKNTFYLTVGCFEQVVALIERQAEKIEELERKVA
jgi:hypothetical protein